jgi:hypothetical protein
MAREGSEIIIQLSCYRHKISQAGIKLCTLRSAKPTVFEDLAHYQLSTLLCGDGCSDKKR